MKKILLPILLTTAFLIFHSLCFAQKNKSTLDSLLYRYQLARSDTERVNKLILISKSALNIKNDSALYYSNKALALSEKIKYTIGIAASNNAIGFDLLKKGDLKPALVYLKKSYSIGKKLSPSGAVLYNIFNIADLYEQKGSYDSSYYFYKQALEYSNQLNSTKYKGDCYENLGEVTRLMGKFNESIDYFFQAVKTYENANHLEGVANANLGIGNLYFSQKKYVEANEYYLKCLDYFKKNNSVDDYSMVYNNLGACNYTYGLSINDSIKRKEYCNKGIEYMNKSLEINVQRGNKSAMARGYGNIGSVYGNEGNYPKAKEYFLKAIDLCKESNNRLSESANYERLGELYTEMNDSTNARINFLTAIKIAKEIKSKEKEMGVYLKYYNFLYSINDFKSAFDYQQLYITSKDSLLNIKNQTKLSELKTLYETEKKENQIQLLSKNKTLQSVLIQKQDIELVSKQIETQKKQNEIELLNKDKALQDLLLKQEMVKKEQQEQKNKLLQVENEFSVKTIKQQKIITVFIIIGLIIVSILAFFIFRGLKKQRKANTTISEQKVLVEMQKEMVEEHQKEITDSIHYAKRIQYALLASDDILQKNLPEHFVLFKPKDIVSGDFYWATEYNNSFYLAVCDSTGHGVPGAFMSILNIGFLSEAIKEKDIAKPNEILNYVRNRLVETISKEGQKDGMDCILIRIESQTANSQQPIANITYAAANNEPILLRDGKITELPKDKMPVGKGEKNADFTLQTITLQKGDSIILYTDGYADQFGGDKGKKFKYKPLNELLLTNQQKTSSEQKELLNKKFEDWQGNLEQVDDVLVIGIKV